MLVIDGRLVGTDDHALYDPAQDRFTDHESDDDCWYVHAPENRGKFLCALDFLSMHNIDIDLSPPERYVHAMREVRCRSQQIPWANVMPEAVHRNWLLMIAREVSGHLARLDTGYYIQTYRHTSRVLRDLERAGVCKRAFMRALNGGGHSNVLNILEAFEPRDDGLADLPTYERQTRTGRLTIADGPNILLLKRSYRQNIFKSIFDGGRVVQLDYAAFEARVAMSLAGRPMVGDPYEYVAKELLDDSSRAQAKQIVLPVMFGLGQARLIETLKCSPKHARKIITRIREYFDLDRIVDALEESVIENGLIHSAYGREVRITDLARGGLYNSYVQSTAVDAALHGFKKIIDHARELGVGFRPLYVLHDALIADASLEAITAITDLTSLGETIPKLNGRFPLEIARLGV